MTVSETTDHMAPMELLRLARFLLKMISRGPVPGRVLLENGIRYRDSDFTIAYSELRASTWYQYLEIRNYNEAVVGFPRHGHIP